MYVYRPIFIYCWFINVLHVFKSVLSLDPRSGLAEGSRSNDTRLYRRCLCAVAVSVKKQHPAIGNRALPAYSAN